MKNIKLSISETFVLYGVYSLIGSVLFFFTTGGWIAMIKGPIVFLTYILIGIIFLIITIILKFKGVSKITFSLKFLSILLLVHSLALLFNSGDCGLDGSSYFLRSIMSLFIMNLEECAVSEYPNIIIFLSYFVLPSVYFILLIAFLKNSLQLSIKENKEITTNIDNQTINQEKTPYNTKKFIVFSLIVFSFIVCMILLFPFFLQFIGYR